MSRSSSSSSTSRSTGATSTKSASTSASKPTSSSKTLFRADEMSSGRGTALRNAASKALGAAHPLSTAGVKATTPTTTAKPPDPIDKLPMSDQAKQNVKDARDGKYGPAVADQTKKAIEATSHLPPTAQAQALGPIGADPKSPAAASAAKVVTSPAFKKLPVDQQTKLCNVVGAASEKGLAALETLTQNPARLSDKDMNGHTLVDNLSELATHAVNADLQAATPDARTQVLDGVLQEVSDPGRYVVQGGYNTCQVTSAQYALVQSNPAEYARLMAGLTGPDGRAVMRGGGVLELQKEHLALGADTRSLSNALFQGAGMEFTNGLIDYDAARDQQNYIVTEHTGLPLFMENGLPANLFGQSYLQNVPLFGNANPHLEFLQQYDTTKNGAPVLLDLALPNMGGDLVHIVTFDHIENGRVYFRNPWGPSNSPVGTESNSGRLEDPQSGLYSMPVDQVKDILSGIHLPADAVGQFERDQAAQREQWMRPPTPPAPKPTQTPTPTP
ncbi:MAG: hypothetical protein ACOZQL_02095 [Myxococcota bacterium]